jgi:magnesium-protoporphyrin IX monomethyl ester (oxidative) cyclase
MKKLKISLINMPFAPLGGPSIGLSQLEVVVKEQFGAQVDLQTLYLNLDFAAKLKGSSFYSNAISSHARMTGLADWFFRLSAFPEAADNTDDYLARYYFADDQETRAIIDFIRNRRQEMHDYLDELIERYDLASSDIVGFSLCFFQTTASIAMANRLKTRNPNMTIVFGGPAVKGVPGKTLVDNVPSVDYVFSGPGLLSFPKLVSCFLAGDLDSIPKIQGVFARGVACGSSSERGVGATLDINADIPLDYGPFLDKFEACMEDTEVSPFLLMQTSRGCWWADKQRCTFCGLNCLSERFEAMSPEHAIRHIQSVLKYSRRVVHFVACDNVAPQNYFKEVFPHLDAPDGVFIKYETRPTITAVEIQTLCDAGIRCVQPGVEALSTESLKLMRKGINAFTNVRFLKDCIRYHLFAEWNILLFSPGEREEVYQKYELDIPRLVHLQPPVDVFPIEFVRDACYFEEAQKFGLELEPHESFFYIYPFDQQTTAGLAFRFTDKNADIEKINNWLERLGGMVQAWRERWNVAPGLRPRLILWRDEHSAVIYDSRFGEGESYRVSDAVEALLKAMDSSPMSAKDAALTCGLEEHAAMEEIVFLKDQGLLFEEDGRYLSLAIVEQA